ncbi:hypothetical protein NIES4103_31260 [Nostoc sp. NIES-4103]|nr:hypothetical protein NIES4103_31260 [Nostoc sp. NIES-4103]
MNKKLLFLFLPAIYVYLLIKVIIPNLLRVYYSSFVVVLMSLIKKSSVTQNNKH